MNVPTETDSLRKDLDQLRQDFTQLSEDVKHRSQDQVQVGMHKAREGASALGDEIESRPYICMLSALGAGLLLGKLISH